ncbi:hypothetical protein B0F90DRAFT_1926006 [Multifurca ochricompacta]|uniref:Proteophosphoglycan ppg4 n=1 Tax=Multifurca ochricompacta TaxID=376703 RepID=A0AAD4M4Z2_9AGAM|nr:hypothetical protein B0F90DRAFT_1926006 [Multifurca ochricompacta]
MARSQPSNNPSPTESRKHQDEPSLQINADVSRALGQSTSSTPTASLPGANDSIEGYPSWLPKRPPHPAPGSTLHSLSTNVMVGIDASPATADIPASSANGSEQLPLPFSGGRKPTPRSVRIVSMQDSSAPAAAAVGVGGVGGGANGAHREPTDQSTRTPDARLRAALVAQPKFRSPGLHLELLRDPSWKTRLHFYLFPIIVFAHIPIQTFLDFNAVFMLIEVAKFPNPDAPGVPGSGRNWVLGAVAYVACWIIWIFGVFLGYELIYSFYRRWRFRRPLILPIYLSSPAYNLVAMTSYNHFCFLQHIRNSALPHVKPSAVLPSAEGSLRDALAETCYFYAQNLPTIVTLLPRAGLALALLLSFFSPEHLPGGLSLFDVDQSIARRDGTFFDKSTGALSGYAKGVLIANAAWAAWRTLVLLLSWVGLWIFSGYGCAGLCGPRSRWEEEEVGRAVSVYSEKSDAVAGVGAAAAVNGVDALPWTWKECTLLRVQEAFDFCLTLRAPRPTQEAGKPSEGGFDGIEKVFAAVGLGGAAQPPPVRRGMLSRDLFESPKDDPSSRSSPENGHGQGQESVALPPEARVRETITEGGKNAPLKKLPYPFPGFGPRESSEQEQIPFPPSPSLPDEGEEGKHDDDEQGEDQDEGEIVVEVDAGEEEEAQPRTSEEPSSFSGRASNSLSSLGQPIPSRYPFSFRHPGRGGSISSTGSPPFAFSRATATPQSKSTSTRASRETRSTGNAETTSSSPSGGSPVSVGAVSSSAPSPQDPGRGGIPMPPRHPAAGAGGRQRTSTVPSPASPTPAGGLTATRPRQRALDEYHSHLSAESLGEAEAEGLHESDPEDDRASRSGQPSPDGSLEAREREDSVGLLSPPSSQPSPRASLLGSRSRNGSAASLARISSAFRPRSRSRHTSSGSGTGTGSGSGASSRHNSHVSVSSVSIALGRARAHSLIQSIAGASRSSIELVLGRVPPSAGAGAMRLEDSLSDATSDGGASSNPENHTFGMPVVGGAGSVLLPRRAGIRARTLESETRRSPSVLSSTSTSTSSSGASAAQRARIAVQEQGQRQGQGERRGHRQGQGQGQGGEQRDSVRARSASSFASSERVHLQTARSFASQGGGSPPSILAQSMRSEEETTSGSTRTQMQTQTQPQTRTETRNPTREPSPTNGIPIPQAPQWQGEGEGQGQGQGQDLSTAATSLVTTPPTIISQTTDSSGRTLTSFGGMEHYVPPHVRNFTPQ